MRLGRQRVDLMVAYPLSGESTVTTANQKLLGWIAAIQNSNSEGNGVASGQMEPIQNGIVIKQLMSEEEFKAAGLSKLSDKELSALNAWVVRQTTAVAEYFAKRNIDSGASGTLDNLLGCSIVGDDGEFLGVISSSTPSIQSRL